MAESSIHTLCHDQTQDFPLLTALIVIKNDHGFSTLNEVLSTFELACHVIE